VDSSRIRQPSILRAHRSRFARAERASALQRSRRPLRTNTEHVKYTGIEVVDDGFVLVSCGVARTLALVPKAAVLDTSPHDVRGARDARRDAAASAGDRCWKHRLRGCDELLCPVRGVGHVAGWTSRDRGPGGDTRFFDEWLGAYEEYEQEVEEIQDLGNGVVFAVFLQHARPTGSSGWVEFRDARVFLWADGLIERVTTFLDIDAARAAAERLAVERR
jgi:hypothetical protein